MKSLDELIEAVEKGEGFDMRDVLHYLCLCRSYEKEMDKVQQIKYEAVRARDRHIAALKELKAANEGEKSS